MPDVAVRFGGPPEGLLAFQTLGESRRLVIASPEYLARHGEPQIPEDLHSHNCLQFNVRRASSDWAFMRDSEMFFLSVSGGIESNSAETLTQLACMGVGIARVAEIFIEAELRSGALVPILKDFYPSDTDMIHAVHVGGSHTPARVQVFIDFIRETLAADPAG